MTWQITQMPTQRSPRSDHIGWLRHGDIHVKVQISHQGVTQEDAFLIIQNFAGILTDGGMAAMLSNSEDVAT